MTDVEFRQAMEACLIPGDAFHHRDHIRLAWIYLREAGPAEATGLIRETIQRYAAHHGAAQKYHETLTVAWLRLVDSAMRSTPGVESFDAFAARHAHLLDKDAPRTFYSAELLSSDRARAEWVEPDLARLPA
jgi:hypothetical protein